MRIKTKFTGLEFTAILFFGIVLPVIISQFTPKEYKFLVGLIGLVPVMMILRDED